MFKGPFFYHCDPLPPKHPSAVLSKTERDTAFQAFKINGAHLVLNYDYGVNLSSSLELL